MSLTIDRMSIGNKAPDIIRVVIEIPKGSKMKYEFDEKLKVLKLDRVLHSSVIYPTDYGFIPGTRGGDGDHLDALVILSEPTFPGCMIEARPIGILDMTDDKGEDEKIIAVAVGDPKMASIQTIDDLDEHTKKEIQNFFEIYKQLEDKMVTIKGWKGRDDTVSIINSAVSVYSSEEH